MIENIITFLHLIFLMVSPFINECAIILNAFILIFFFFHFVFKYGKCGIINIERFFLQEIF
jgi:hypothetical protein